MLTPWARSFDRSPVLSLACSISWLGNGKEKAATQAIRCLIFLDFSGSSEAFSLRNSKLTLNTAQLYLCIYFVLENKCEEILPDQREDCGYYGIKREECEDERGCCFDDTVPDVPWCFKEPIEGSTDEPVESNA